MNLPECNSWNCLSPQASSEIGIWLAHMVVHSLGSDHQNMLSSFITVALTNVKLITNVRLSHEYYESSPDLFSWIVHHLDLSSGVSSTL